VSDPENDFAAMFEASFQAKQYEKGQTVEGTIVGFGHDVAFVDVGGKGEAVVDVEELKNSDGVLEAAVGDRIRAVVVSTSGGLTLSRRLARGAATDSQLAEAFHANLPVEGKVEREIKGGYEVRIGRQRAFCPISQIDIARTTDPAAHVGRTYSFKLVEYREGGRNIVVSRRALLEQEQRARADEVRRSIVPGAVLKGRVVSVREFGAFVDLGGVQGLLHVSDMGWSRLSSAAEAVTAGDEIAVKVLRVDEATQKIALGTKQLSEDPWSLVSATFEVGQVHTGHVTRVTDFGAFVELAPGIEGLAHASTFPPTGTPRGWAASVPVGLAAAFEILSVDAPARRIGVALVPPGSTREGEAVASPVGLVPGARVTGTVERVEKFGVFVFLGPGRTGLMPLSETGVAREGDVVKEFPIGSNVDVVVLEVGEAGRRIRVSHKAVLDAQETDELREYRERGQSAPADGFGSLADKLRSVFEPPKR
jgi:small subunit ribosomal protein S1